ncbi:MAG: hypothetical protein PHW80_10350 [Smithellaceae bacterium]|nr:hypothetical protein [Smithellaceae bacterium]HOG11302.1 hypothetical protein [Smithella sp.]MDD3258403.1 hypothetical protein [Smithellaceae bacterium]MDD3849686.1 hypothetical protein [Smithellaceae bacterium]HOQ72610.1 hypothetical protein [Smithellaceae bacterium]
MNEIFPGRICVLDRHAHGSQFVPEFGAVERDAARGFGHAVAVIGRLPDVMEETGDFRF